MYLVYFLVGCEFVRISRSCVFRWVLAAGTLAFHLLDTRTGEHLQHKLLSYFVSSL